VKQPSLLAEGVEKSLIALFVLILVWLENEVNVVMGAKLRKVERKTKEIHFFFLPRRRSFLELCEKVRHFNGKVLAKASDGKRRETKKRGKSKRKAD
jgi:hypothetical protein